MFSHKLGHSPGLQQRNIQSRNTSNVPPEAWHGQTQGQGRELDQVDWLSDDHPEMQPQPVARTIHGHRSHLPDVILQFLEQAYMTYLKNATDKFEYSTDI